MKKTGLTIICFLIIFASLGQGGEQMKQSLVFKIDSLGNASIEVSSKLTATQWQQWENTYGGKNISLFKRDISRTMNEFYLYDFDYESDAMERTFKVTFKAKGVARYLGGNEWLAEMGMKDPDFSRLSDNSFLVTTTYNDGGVLIQQNNTIFFPSKAINVNEDTDEFGYATFTYDLKPVTASMTLFLILGLVFIGLGIGSGVFLALKHAPEKSAG